MDGKNRRTLLGVVAVILILIALVAIGLQWQGQRRERESVLPKEPPSWFGTGAGAPSGQ
ncbi:MAG: hypothetical protein RMM06_11290 [Armatimonadota bacterium]|nr:hypothetical protein [Armatimonadota bacterium]MDW8105753.1 hypothetical protein [Armatimonadota bacterium]MDW8291297.1 hypothetical protein [Armatimonadota bacterium]